MPISLSSLPLRNDIVDAGNIRQTTVDANATQHIFHVLQIMADKPTSGATASAQTSEASILMLLDSMNQFLSRNDRHVADRRLYQHCPETTPQEVLRSVLKDDASHSPSKSSDLDLIKEEIRKARVTIYLAADRLFKIFLPADFQGPTISKYWGAVERILKVTRLMDRSFNLSAHY